MSRPARTIRRHDSAPRARYSAAPWVYPEPSLLLGCLEAMRLAAEERAAGRVVISIHARPTVHVEVRS